MLFRSNLLTGDYFAQNVANLFFLPRAPVMVSTNELMGRYYLDLNQNGRFDAYGMVPQIGPSGGYLHPDGTEDLNLANVVTNMAPGGDPEWVGVLEHPDAPHSANNHFIARYAFIALPIGNTLDVNYLHNEARNTGLSTSDGYMRNQGVGSWEINLAAFLADLNTNIWDNNLTQPYYYYEPVSPNTGYAFEDARALLSYRYNGNYSTLASVL